MANVFWMAGISVAYVASIANTPRGMRGRRRRRRKRIRRRISGSDILKVEGPPPGSASIGSGSGLVISEDGYVLTNCHVLERAYDMTLVSEEQTRTQLSSFQTLLIKSWERGPLCN